MNILKKLEFRTQNKVYKTKSKSKPCTRYVLETYNQRVFWVPVLMVPCSPRDLSSNCLQEVLVLTNGTLIRIYSSLITLLLRQIDWLCYALINACMLEVHKCKYEH